MPSNAERQQLVDHAIERFGYLDDRGAARTVASGDEFTVLTYQIPEAVFEFEFDWREMLTTLSIRDVGAEQIPEDGRLVADGRHVRHGFSTALHLAGITAAEFHRDAREVQGHWGTERVKSLIDTKAAGLAEHLDGILTRMDRIFPASDPR